MNLKDARILITGGSMGIGKAAAAQLIAKGARVGITGRDAGQAEQTAHHDTVSGGVGDDTLAGGPGVDEFAIGDRVTVEISPYDLEKGRITFRHRN